MRDDFTTAEKFKGNENNYLCSLSIKSKVCFKTVRLKTHQGVTYTLEEMMAIRRYLMSIREQNVIAFVCFLLGQGKVKGFVTPAPTITISCG